MNKDYIWKSQSKNWVLLSNQSLKNAVEAGGEPTYLWTTTVEQKDAAPRGKPAGLDVGIRAGAKKEDIGSIRQSMTSKSRPRKTGAKKNNLSNYSTQLANINELGVAIEILRNIHPDHGSLTEMRREFNEVEENLREQSGAVEGIDGAIATKKDQALQLGKHIFFEYSKRWKITDVGWTNTKQRFCSFCVVDDHNNNPADIAIKYTENGAEKYLGISLKASFGKTDIGQYNSSICSFISGLVFIEDGSIIENSQLENHCKCKRGQQVIPHGMEIQNKCNDFKNETYADIAEIMAGDPHGGFNGTKTRGDKVKIYKEFFELKDNIYIVKQESILTVRETLLSRCRDYYFDKIKGETLVDGGKRVPVPLNICERIFANYLRINLSMGKGQVIPYIKASLLGDTVNIDGSIEQDIKAFNEEMISNYIPSDGNILLNYKKSGSGTIKIWCEGAKKGILCRIKFGGTPPSAFKIDGVNFYVDPLTQKGGVGTVASTFYSWLPPWPQWMSRTTPDAQLPILSEGISMNLYNLLETDQKVLLFELIDRFLHDTDNIGDMKVKIDTITDIDHLRKLFKGMGGRSIRRLKFNLVRGADLDENFWYEFMDILNMYIDDRYTELVNENFEKDDEICLEGSSGGGRRTRRRTRRNTRRKNTRRRSTRRGKNTRRRSKRSRRK